MKMLAKLLLTSVKLYILLSILINSLPQQRVNLRGSYQPITAGDSSGNRMYLSALIEEMAWHQIGAKAFLESMLILDRLHP